MTDRPSQPISVANNVNSTPEWEHGYLHRFVQHGKQSLSGEPIDSGEQIIEWFADAKRIVVLGASPSTAKISISASDGVIFTADRFLESSLTDSHRSAVVLNYSPDESQLIASKYHSLPAARRPLLLSTYLPNSHQDAVKYGLPRPTPLVPLLIRCECYAHQPNELPPSPTAFANSLAMALVKSAAQRGIELSTTAT